MPNSYIAKHKGAIMQTVNDMIEYLIKHSDEVADAVLCYRTTDGELVVSTNAYDPVTAIGLITCAQQVMVNRECYEDDE
jgi:hypothetical protein